MDKFTSMMDDNIMSETKDCNCDKFHADGSEERGISLEHGDAHTQDHTSWSRRDFLNRIGAASLGASFIVAGKPVQTFAGSPLLNQLQQVENDRVLVLIQLAGGNDGLSTVVPITNDVYYNRRPTLSISPNVASRLNDDYGLHPKLEPLTPLWQDGQMSIVNGVGYADTNLSHFRSTDIWVSASDADVEDDTGWVGRHLDSQYPDFSELESPVAVQIGSFTPILFQGPDFRMGISTPSVEAFEQIAQTGAIFDEDNVAETSAGEELLFLRQISNRTITYGAAIREAYNDSSNLVEYEQATGDYWDFSKSLASVARSIRGRLGTKIYVVQLPNFDTHTFQEGQHGALMEVLGKAIANFYQDLSADGLDADVLTVTFSEFGRRVEENGGRGTDHGTAAPLFAFGPPVKGGFFGDPPSLTDLDSAGNLKHGIDFRSIYSTLLHQWFGISELDTAAILGRNFDPVNFIESPFQTSSGSDSLPSDFLLEQNYPNPFNPITNITFSLKKPGRVKLSVYTSDGRELDTLINSWQATGKYDVPFDASNYPSGTYLYVLEAVGYKQTRKMTLLR